MSLPALLAEAQAAVSSSANTLRDVRERYRAAYLAQVDHWQALRAAMAARDDGGADGGADGGGAAQGGAAQGGAAQGGAAQGGAAQGAAAQGTEAQAAEAQAAEAQAAEAQAAAGTDARRHESLRRDEAVASQEVGAERSALARVELAVKSLENAWLFLAREDNSLVGDLTSPTSPVDLQMRIVEAQEAERSRLAREVHDGPAQALSNAIFQVEVVQRLLDRDERLARAELRGLREVLSRELRGVRAYLSQLRPPLLADLGLSGAIHEAAGQIESALGIPVVVDLGEGIDRLPETIEIVILRVVQEALQNARKHAGPTSIRIRVESETDGGWTVEVRDDGRGFDMDGRTDGPRRNFGLQFMRERAELIGARFEVRSGQDLGTVVRLSIPPGAMGMPIPGEVVDDRDQDD